MSASPISTHRILLAEDEASQRELLRGGVERLGYCVNAVENGIDALAMLNAADPPRIALLDWNMPGMSGPELCRKIRENQDRQYVYIILLTSRNAVADLQSGLASGADDYITKPVSPLELKARIDVGIRVVDDSDRITSINRELVNANEMLAAFSRTLAHDLRGSLHTIGGWAYLAAQNANDPESVIELTQNIERANERAALLVDDVLILETAARDSRRASVDVEPLVRELALEVATANVTIGSIVPTVFVHYSSFSRSLKNLLENAAKYGVSDEHPMVNVRVSILEIDDMWTLIVEDDGPGVPERDRARLFDAFERGSNTEDVHGTGLGLSIVAACARTHDGDVRVDKSDLGGARFTVNLRKSVPNN